jgi:hypothetical protein
VPTTSPGWSHELDGASVIRARVSLGVAGVVSAVAGVWFASSWLDATNGDSTCGSLWQVGTWPHVRGCAGPMTVRLVIALVLAGLALGAWWLSATKPPKRALFVSLAIVVIAGGVLVVNESVRSDGLWAAGAAPVRGSSL